MWGAHTKGEKGRDYRRGRKNNSGKNPPLIDQKPGATGQRGTFPANGKEDTRKGPSTAAPLLKRLREHDNNLGGGNFWGPTTTNFRTAMNRAERRKKRKGKFRKCLLGERTNY